MVGSSDHPPDGKGQFFAGDGTAQCNVQNECSSVVCATQGYIVIIELIGTSALYQTVLLSVTLSHPQIIPQITPFFYIYIAYFHFGASVKDLCT